MRAHVMFVRSPTEVLTHGNHSSEVCVGMHLVLFMQNHPEVEWFWTPQGAIVSTGMTLTTGRRGGPTRVGIPPSAITSVHDLRDGAPRAMTDPELDAMIAAHTTLQQNRAAVARAPSGFQNMNIATQVMRGTPSVAPRDQLGQASGSLPHVEVIESVAPSNLATAIQTLGLQRGFQNFMFNPTPSEADTAAPIDLDGEEDETSDEDMDEAANDIVCRMDEPPSAYATGAAGSGSNPNPAAPPSTEATPLFPELGTADDQRRAAALTNAAAVDAGGSIPPNMIGMVTQADAAAIALEVLAASTI